MTNSPKLNAAKIRQLPPATQAHVIDAAMRKGRDLDEVKALAIELGIPLPNERTMDERSMDHFAPAPGPQDPFSREVSPSAPITSVDSLERLIGVPCTFVFRMENGVERALCGTLKAADQPDPHAGFNLTFESYDPCTAMAQMPRGRELFVPRTSAGVPWLMRHQTDRGRFDLVRAHPMRGALPFHGDAIAGATRVRRAAEAVIQGTNSHSVSLSNLESHTLRRGREENLRVFRPEFVMRLKQEQYALTAVLVDALLRAAVEDLAATGFDAKQWCTHLSELRGGRVDAFEAVANRLFKSWTSARERMLKTPPASCPYLGPAAERLREILAFRSKYLQLMSPVNQPTLEGGIDAGLGTATLVLPGLAKAVLANAPGKSGDPAARTDEPQELKNIFLRSTAMVRRFASMRLDAFVRLYGTPHHFPSNYFALKNHGPDTTMLDFREGAIEKMEARYGIPMRWKLPDTMGCPALVHLHGSNAIQQLIDFFELHLPDCFAWELERRGHVGQRAD